jgi:hypothetical protein
LFGLPAIIARHSETIAPVSIDPGLGVSLAWRMPANEAVDQIVAFSNRIMNYSSHV